jgi:DNA polymerase III alpha subunit (gram-positive type)
MFSRVEVLIGHNVRFDLDMLQAELRRAGLGAVELGDKLIVDTYRLWASQEPRDLLHAHQRFVGTDYQGAHRAQADVTATAAVLSGMITAFSLDGADWADLAELCGPDGRFHYIEHR